MTDMTVDEAKRVVAECALASKAEFEAAYGLDWGDYPDIGERDWVDVANLAQEISRERLAALRASFEEAYKLLAARATCSPTCSLPDGHTGSHGREDSTEHA